MKVGQFCLPNKEIEAVRNYLNDKPELDTVLEITFISDRDKVNDYNISVVTRNFEDGSFSQDELIIIDKENNPEYFL